MAERWWLNLLLGCGFSPVHSDYCFFLPPHSRNSPSGVTEIGRVFKHAGCLKGSLQIPAWISLPLQPAFSCRWCGVWDISQAHHGLHSHCSLLNSPWIMCFREILCRCSVMPAKVHQYDGLGLDCSEGKGCVQQPLMSLLVSPLEPQKGIFFMLATFWFLLHGWIFLKSEYPTGWERGDGGGRSPLWSESKERN